MFSQANKFYYASTRGKGMQRRKSYCVYGPDAQQRRYHRTEEPAQQTRYSLTYVMKEEKDENANLITIKDFNYQLNLASYPAQTTHDDINNYLQRNHELATREAQFNAMMNNHGAVCVEAERVKLQADFIGGQPCQKLISYPHVYLALNFVPGIALADFAFTSAAEFLDLSIAILVALHRMHELFIHSNLNAYNILLQKDEQGNVTPRFTDFSAGRLLGSRCYPETNQEDQPPELLTESILFTDPTQDIYQIAKVLQKLLYQHRRLFFTNIEVDINRVFSQMSHQTPNWRISLPRAIEFLTAIDKHPEREVKRRLTMVRTNLINPTERFTRHLIDWCYYTTLEYQVIHQFDHMLEPEALAILQANDYFVRTRKKEVILAAFFRVFDHSEKLLTALKQLQEGDAKLPITALDYLHHARKDYLATVFNTEEKLSQLTNMLPPVHLGKMLVYLLDSFQAFAVVQNPRPDAVVNAKLTYAFIQLYCLEFNTNYFMQDAWQAYKGLINADWNIDVVQAFQIVANSAGFNLIKFFSTIPENFILPLLQVLDVATLKPKITTMHQLHSIYAMVASKDRREVLKIFGQEYLLSLSQFAHVEVMPGLHHFMQDISKSFDRDFMLQILKNYCSEVFYYCQQDWEPTLNFLDGFNNEPQAALYASILYCCNQIYGDLRATQPNSLTTLFGAYKRDDKVAASKHLQTQLLENTVNAETFKCAGLMQGDLGKIARRLKYLYFPKAKPAASRRTFPLR